MIKSKPDRTFDLLVEAPKLVKDNSVNRARVLGPDVKQHV